MADKRPMPLLLIEDDVSECLEFNAYALSRADIRLVGITPSSKEGLDMVKVRVPEGVILDLELHNGLGSGVDFLNGLNEANLSRRPFIAVTTNCTSGLVYNVVRGLGVDWVHCKAQKDYSHEMVVNLLLTARSSLHASWGRGMASDLVTTESPEDQRERIIARITEELDLICFNRALKGHGYLLEALYFLLASTGSTPPNAIELVAEQHGHSYNSVHRTIQTAIINAWKRAPIEDLVKHYTAGIKKGAAEPSPAEFLKYYADKIHGSI